MAEGRILQLLGPSKGGIRRVVLSLTDALRQRGWSVVVAGPPGALDGIGRLDVEVPIPDFLALPGLVRSRRELGPLAAEFDLVHAHGLKPGLLAASLRPRPPLVVSVHNLVLDEVAAARLAGAGR